VASYDAGSMLTPVVHEYDVAANWKVVVENYQECYHCSMIHPELCQVSPPDSGENLDQDGNWVGGWMDLRAGAETMSLDGHSGGVAIARLDEHEKRTVMYVAVLPNLLISLHPDYVMTHLLTPLSPERTRIRCSWSFPADVAGADGFDPAYAVDFWDLTNRQDWAACESVQRGMRAPRFEPGPLAPDEDGVYQFVSYVARAYQGSPDA
jgi:glycine betaine catabolism A